MRSGCCARKVLSRLLLTQRGWELGPPQHYSRVRLHGAIGFHVRPSTRTNLQCKINKTIRTHTDTRTHHYKRYRENLKVLLGEDLQIAKA